MDVSKLREEMKNGFVVCSIGFSQSCTIKKIARAKKTFDVEINYWIIFICGVRCSSLVENLLVV